MIDVTLFHWVQLVAAIAFSFLIVYKSIPVLIELAYHKDLYDKPDGERKVHTQFISNFGGVAIFIAFTSGFLFSGFAQGLTGLPYFTGALLGLFFCGLKDDLIGLAPKTKLFVELIVAVAVMSGMGLMIDQFGGVFGINSIPMWLAIPVTLFTMIVVINAYNLIDGIDGLAGGVAAIASATFSIGFFYAGDLVFGIMSLTLMITSIGYLFHNFHPANIFMGDTGSLVVGFLLSVFAIRFISLNELPAFHEIFGNASVVIPIAALSIPLYDTLRVFARRIARGQSPFTADSDHIHHTLLRMGLGQRRTVLYLYAATIVITSIAYLSSSLNVNLSLIIVVFSMVLFLPTMGLKRKFALFFGVNLEYLLSPKKEVDMYHHLEVENKNRGKSTERSARETFTE